MEREINGTGEEVGLLVLEAKSLRPFKTKDEYLYAMKEDLAEWFKCLYEDVCITAENFLEVLETGVLLCQHANEVRKFVAEQKEKGDFQMKSNFVRNIQIPQYEVQFRIDVKPETFLARDNVSNFITWTVKMGIPEVLRFETDDLVLRKNERSVVLCLLEVARVGAKFGMLAPTIVQMEEEIDEEIATGEPPPQIKTCDIKSLDEMVRELVGRCTCPIQFPIIKVGEGKYKIGDSQTLVFVRILRKHVMIRVGGGWDTLEHYLDRHDPCRCSFQGHRQVGRGPVTPRRSSIAGTAQTQMNTPRTPRRSSVTSIIKSPPAQTSLRDSIRRSVSPEVNSKKTKRSYSQPGSAVTSPDDSVKSFSGTEHFTDTSKSSRVPYVSRTNSAQKLNSFSSRVNASSMGPTETRRSASPSPGIKRSESPALDPANRLRSPSPAPSNSKNNTANRNKSVPACLSKRCASPVKQITMSELKSSREGKPAVAILRRQASVESEGCDSDTVKSSESGITIDKISTMSLGEFKSLLNSALSVPHSTESQGSLDSPRSQSSADSYKNSQFPKEKRTSVTRNTHNVTGANCGFSSSSTSSDKPKRSPTSTVVRSVNSPASKYAQTPNSGTNVRTKTPSSDSAKTARIVTKRSNFSKTLMEHSKTESSPFLDSQPKILSSTYQNYSQSSLNSEGSSVRLNNTSSLPSRCSSQSSFKSNDSLCETESCASSDLLRVETTDSLLNYTRSNSYTPTADRDKWAEPRSEIRACSEPKEVVKSDTVSEKHPLNVGYARFSHEDDAVLSPTYQFDEELSKIESELKKYASGNDNIENEEPVRKPQPSMRRPSTPSLIPRPATPKMSRKLSLTTDSENHVVDKQSHFMGRPPTAKHSNVVENSSIRSADAGKGKAYKDIFQSKRSKTPSPGNVSTNSISDNVRRCTTPGPNMSLKSTLSATSATVTRESLNQTLKLSKDASSLEHDEAKTADQSIRTKPGSSSGQRDLTERRNSVPSRSLNRQSSTKDSETVIMVNRTDAGHSLTVEDQAKPPHKQSAKRPTVLARARTENVRSRAQTRTNNGISRQRPQSVEPRQLIPRANLTTVASEQTTGMNSHRSGDGSDSIYNRTQEWVQTATEQTSKVQKMKQVNPVRRRAMTPNSFDIGIERDEPRSLDEIKAALTLPVNGLNRIEIDTEDLDAPPEDPEMYATMEKLFNELRKQELKASVNETPGSNIIPGRLGKSKSKSSSSANDEEASLNSNKNIENNRSNVSLSTGSSNVISPSVTKKTSSDLSVSKPTTGSQPLRNSSSRSTNSSPSSLTQPRTTTLKSAPPRPASPSMNRPAQTTRPPSPRTYKNVQPARPASPGINRNVQPPRPASPGINKNVQPARPASPSINKIVQPERPASPSMNKRSQPQRPASPSVTRSTNPPRPASPRTTVTTESSRSHIQRPASPHLSPSPSKTLVTASRSLQTSQNSIKHSTASQKPRQPPRPASTPPKPSRANGRPSVSGARDDTEESLGNDKENSDGASLISKLKQIINVKPRKDKAEGVKQKSRIPAPKSLASAGRSRSFTNLASVGRSMSLPSETENINGHLDFSYTESEMNRVNIENDITEGLNVTISGKSEVPKLKMAMPLTTGRATVIRKESIEKNKNPPRLIRAVSVERNIGDLRSDFQFYREGEYV